MRHPLVPTTLKLRNVAAGLLAGGWLAGCSSWLPAAHEPPRTLSAAPVGVAADAGDWPATEWWRKYADATLDTLMTQASASAPSIANAEARFNNAREAVRVTAAGVGLRINGEASLTRQRLSDHGLFPIDFLGFNWYSQGDLGLRASYNFDWWHKRQAATEAAMYQARAAQAESRAAILALSGSIADSYFGWQVDQAQLVIVDEQLALVERRQHITAVRMRAELEPIDSQLQLDSDVAGLRALRIELGASAQLRRVVIAALLGVELEQLPVFSAQPLPAVSLALPDDVRVDLLARRPDIVASRWRIEAQQQQLRAARAEFMPDISINALAALSSIDLDKLLNSGSATPGIGVALHLPIFDSGLLKAQYGARAAQLDGAIANYNGVVISAAREVATQALTLQQLLAQRSQRQAQLAAAEQLLSVTSARRQQGLSDGRPVLLARQQVQQQQAALTRIDAAMLSADINLQVALGGGYADVAH